MTAMHRVRVGFFDFNPKRKKNPLSRGAKIGLGVAAIAASGLVVYAATRPKAPAKATVRPRPAPGAQPLEIYKGLEIYVTKDGAAWRWIVGKDRLPLATGLSVLQEEARIAARNWVDLVTGTSPASTSSPGGDPYVKALAPRPGEPTDLAAPGWSSLRDYWILVQTSPQGYSDNGDVEHFRWRIMRNGAVVTTGWADTPRDAKDEAIFAIAADYYKRGIEFVIPGGE